ncbi:hypothetical protein [Planococcus halotolerans]|uniref:Uncharacterized protein n=1 Tax=Planococcus halotolerans TaxID=2233542 RepID=A0A365KLP6_9BACL|nr:hypothetical protein [Planococcus halotolerans]RAZ73618.1 hypothetical protein DP120_16920 [Planococcus halotolerans]
MPEMQLLDWNVIWSDFQIAFGPFAVALIPVIIAAVVLLIIKQLIPKGVLRQIFGIVSMVIIVYIAITSISNTTMNW